MDIGLSFGMCCIVILMSHFGIERFHENLICDTGNSVSAQPNNCNVWLWVSFPAQVWKYSARGSEKPIFKAFCSK